MGISSFGCHMLIHVSSPVTMPYRHCSPNWHSMSNAWGCVLYEDPCDCLRSSLVPSMHIFGTQHAHLCLIQLVMEYAVCITSETPSSLALSVSWMCLFSLIRALAQHTLLQVVDMLACRTLSSTSVLPLLKTFHHNHICF